MFVSGPFSPKLTAIYLFIQSKILSFWLHNVKLHAWRLCRGLRHHVVAGRNSFAACFCCYQHICFSDPISNCSLFSSSSIITLKLDQCFLEICHFGETYKTQSIYENMWMYTWHDVGEPKHWDRCVVTLFWERKSTHLGRIGEMVLRKESSLFRWEMKLSLTRENIPLLLTYCIIRKQAHKW